METRKTLIIILVGIICLVTLVLGVLIYSLVRPSSNIKAADRVEQSTTEIIEPPNPWAEQGDAVISLVKSMRSAPFVFSKLKKEEKEAGQPAKRNNRRGKKKEAEPEETPKAVPFADLIANKEFVKDILKIRGKEKGWDAEWWGETKYGQTFYLVRFVFTDGLVDYGPEWLVDLKTRKVKPKNIYAELISDPKKGVESTYFDKEGQIISAIASHRFDSKMSLAGALLVYFEQQDGSDEGENDIRGWTVVHDTENAFRSYFQWTANNVEQYAEFEFDYNEKRLKASNFQAAEIMKVGEDFTQKRVDIMPQSYDPEASPKNRWIGPSKKACAMPAYKENCDAFATMLEQKEIIESVEWLLTAREENEGEFTKCQELRNCAWKPEQIGPNEFNVTYEYKLDATDEKPRTISWRVKPKEKEIFANDSVSRLALLSIRPRDDQSSQPAAK